MVTLLATSPNRVTWGQGTRVRSWIVGDGIRIGEGSEVKNLGRIKVHEPSELNTKMGARYLRSKVKSHAGVKSGKL